MSQGARGRRKTAPWPEAAAQRCWNHKLLNVLDQLPKKVQAEARAVLKQIPHAPARTEAERRRDAFAKLYGRWYPKAVAVLEDDWERLVTFYDFPEPPWKHVRTTNVVESPFAAVRLRTSAAKRFKKVANATALISRLLTGGGAPVSEARCPAAPGRRRPCRTLC